MPYMYKGLIHKVGFFVKQNLESAIQAVKADCEQFYFPFSLKNALSVFRRPSVFARSDVRIGQPQQDEAFFYDRPFEDLNGAVWL